MSIEAQVSASAAVDAYDDRRQGNSQLGHNTNVFLAGHKYTVFGHISDPSTGFQATAYRSIDVPHNIIIAYRGTELSIKDAAVDFRMVRDRVNPQKADADAFTAAMIKKAEAHGIPRDQITLAGHSLGGTLAEIEAWEFKLHGVTINAYGAVDLGYGVPEGGTLITGYVMAGDVVSAASRHFGRTVPLASDADIQSLVEGRYIDAAPGARAPNPLLAMRLSDHSSAHFSPSPGSGEASVLDPAEMAHYARNYAEHKEAIDRFRHDVYSERAEVALALRHADDLDLPAIWSGLPPKVQQQLAEYHTKLMDQYVRTPIEHNALFTGIEEGLGLAGARLRGTGQDIQNGADQFARTAQEAGQYTQQRTNAFAQSVQQAPLDPLTKLETIAGMKAARYGVRAETEGIAGTSKLAGRALHAATRFAAHETEAARDAIKQTAHLAGEVATEVVHEVEGKAVAANHAYYNAEAAAERLIGTGEDVRRTLSQTVDAVGHATRYAYETATHPADGFGHDAAAKSNLQPFSDASHPQHAMYSALEKLLPQGTSEARLSQATAACHKAGVNDPKDIERIYVTDTAAIFMFKPMWAATAQMDLTHPAPSIEQTLHQVQLHDQQQARVHTQMNAQRAAQVQQGPVR